MKQMRSGRHVGLVGLVLAAGWGAGCGRPAEPTEAAVPPPVAEVSAEVAAEVAAPVVPEEAPHMRAAHPLLASGVLTYARLAALPPGVLLQAEGVRVTAADLEADWQQAPPNMRAQLEKNRLLLLEQRATESLLRRAAHGAGPGTADDDMLQGFIQQLTAQADVSEAEIKAFHDENLDMVGGSPWEQVAPRIRQHLLQQKQQQVVMEYIRNLGQNQVIAVAADWVAEQAAA
ncbi:MAG: hypothetical protein K9N49_08990, partial [Candidatus Marinimicrobia bacterium]|nr:hypothetical protein [Candidatus Neomarinimicrobiota bacterium]